MQVAAFFSAANPVILCAPPQISVVAGRTRSDLSISPTRSGVTTSNTQNKPESNKLACRVFSRSSCVPFGYFSHLKLPCVAVAQLPNPSILKSHLIWRVTRKPVQTPGKPEIIIISSLFLLEVIIISSS